MSDPWRERCPKGHSSWEFRGAAGYYCQRCQENFDTLVDWKTKQPVPVDQ